MYHWFVETEVTFYISNLESEILTRLLEISVKSLRTKLRKLLESFKLHYFRKKRITGIFEPLTVFQVDKELF